MVASYPGRREGKSAGYEAIGNGCLIFGGELHVRSSRLRGGSISTLLDRYVVAGERGLDTIECHLQTFALVDTCTEKKFSEVLIFAQEAHFRIMRKFTPFENFPLYGIVA